MGLGPQRKDSKTFGTTVYDLTHPNVNVRKSSHSELHLWAKLVRNRICTLLKSNSSYNPYAITYSKFRPNSSLHCRFKPNKKPHFWILIFP